MPTVVELAFKHDAHQFLRRRTHVLVALTEGYHGEAIILQILHHHAGVPAVVGNLADVIALIQLADELLNETVVHHIALGGHDVPLALPYIVHHVVAAYAQRKRVFRQPEEW